MAINLNPGADATLVNVAYRAAMANTPSDYSNTLERAADSYSETMKASAEMWGNVAKVGASIGSDMIANAKEFTDMAALAGGLDSEGASFLQDEVYSIKDEINALGVFNGALGNRETKQKKAELKIKQAQLFADIDLAGASVKAGADAVAAGTFDVSLAMEDAEIVNAIIKSNLKNKVTNENNIARLSRDEETGELVYTMYDVSNNPDGEETGQTMTIKEFNNSVATNVKDGGAKAQGFNKYNEQVVNRGFKSRTGAYDEQMRATDSNWIETQLQNPIDLKRALHMKFGYSDTSIFDDLTKNEGEYSASLYRDLLSVTGGKNGLTGDIVDGIVDEGKPGINELELQNSENYKILTGNLLGLKDPDVTRAYFKDYALKEFEKANNYGHGNKAPVAGSGTETDGKLDFYSKGQKIERLGNKGYMSGGTATGIYNKIQAGDRFDAQDPITGETNNYSYQNIGDDTGWYENYQEGDDKSSVQYIGSNGGDVGGKFTNDPRWQNIDTSVEEEVDAFGQVIGKEAVKGTESSFSPSINMSFMDKDDNNIAISLQNMMPNAFTGQNPNGYKFKNLRSIVMDDFTAEAVGLYDDDENIVRYPEGHPKEGDKVIIYTGGNKERRMTAISTLDDILNTEQFKIKGFGSKSAGNDEYYNLITN